MKLYTRGRYALRLMVAVARHEDGGEAVSLGTLAAVTLISRRYLEQLATTLRRHGLLRAVSGRAGGYLLGRPADQITVAEVLAAAIGPINIVECIRHPESCLEADGCECRWVYEQLNTQIQGLLDGLTLATLVERGLGHPRGRDLSAVVHGCPTTTA